MKKLQFKRLGFLIGFTLLVSIGVQAWRMYAQFKIIRHQLIMDIQQSLDNAVESYFAEIAKTDVITLTDEMFTENISFEGDSTSGFSHQITKVQVNRSDGPDSISLMTRRANADSDSVGIPEKFLERVGKSNLVFRSLTKAQGEKLELDSIFWQNVTTDSTHSIIRMDPSRNIGRDQTNHLGIFLGRSAADSLEQLKFLTNKIIISITRDSLDFDKIQTFLQEELRRRGIEINYQLIQANRKPPLLGEIPPIQDSLIVSKPDMPFKTISRSAFLPPGQSLELYFENTAQTILRRGILEIAMSVAFLGIIAFAFYYLYQTIRNQKEIAEIKEDLIGNITHEFKTPIATTLSAIEGIELFNPENDPQKTKKYLGISKLQMHKLNQMVEKLLETATIDSENLVLKKESVDPEPILRNLLEKFRTLDPEKEFELILPANSRQIEVDPFHFENVISNLLDNALKYGGSQIRICMDQSNKTKIKIWDNGGKIGSEQKERVFEQFYRIPKGNIHDVKGFGIGLYYVKKIIEKHGGKIELDTAPKSTTFITIWP